MFVQGVKFKLNTCKNILTVYFSVQNKRGDIAMNKLLAVMGLSLAAGSILSGDVASDGYSRVMKSSLAGSWFSAGGKELRDQLAAWVAEAAEHDKGELKGEVIALLQPHAGYIYSGSIAAYGLNKIKGKSYDRVIVIGPSHRVWLENSICVPKDADALETPFGRTGIDADGVKALAKNSFVVSDDKTHYAEHSVQIHLPMLQFALGEGFKILPVICGQLDNDAVMKIAAAIKPLLNDRTLLVISSDFTHYGQNFDYVPFKNDIKENLEKLDLGAFKMIKGKNLSGFTEYIENTQATICGRDPIRIMLKLLPGNAEVSLLKYSTSGDITGDFKSSVSYVSAVATGKWENSMNNNGAHSDELDSHDKKTLLKIAREAIESALRERKAPSSERFDSYATENMKKKMGAFVTLKKGEQLRGCIGEIEPRRALYKAVADRAIDSAFGDPRFQSVSASELGDIEIEISALTPSKKVDSYKDIIIGKHGMTVTKSGRSAVFLPQVAPEQGWTLEETLTHLSMKAGLPPDAWKSGAEFTVFEAIVFKESDFRK